jgi:hypothetical protein
MVLLTVQPSSRYINVQRYISFVIMQELNVQFLITHGTKTTFNSAHDAVSLHVRYKHHTLRLSNKTNPRLQANLYSHTQQ